MLMSNMNNDARKDLGISIYDYQVALAIHFFAYSPYNEERWAYKKSKDIATLYDLSVRTIATSILNLEAKGLVERNGHHRVRTTKLWNDVVSAHSILKSSMLQKQDISPKDQSKTTDGGDEQSTNQKFEIFWEAYRKLNHREKPSALAEFKKVAKHFDEIMAAIPLYEKELKEKEWMNPKMASGWLKKGRWTDFDAENYAEKKSGSGAVVEKIGFAGFADRCCALSCALFGKDLDHISVKNSEVFSDQEKILIEKIGFKKIIQNCQDGDFMDKVELEWEAML